MIWIIIRILTGLKAFFEKAVSITLHGMIQLFYFHKNSQTTGLIPAFYSAIILSVKLLCFMGYDIINSVKVPSNYTFKNTDFLHKTIYIF